MEKFIWGATGNVYTNQNNMPALIECEYMKMIMYVNCDETFSTWKGLVVMHSEVGEKLFTVIILTLTPN